METFIEFTIKLNNLAISFQNKESNEYINYDIASEAQNIINNMNINNINDVLLYLVSLNLLNTYVKQKDTKIGYYFKSDITPLIKRIDDLDLKDISMYFTRENNSTVIYFMIGKIQFSFHGINKNIVIPNKYLKYQEFDHIRKHLCALTLFNRVINNM